ncbi:unnamed protein product [Lactuca saligna]|uniref:Uncharacterized protein n=1 Tax=Lactuca saligna TaxID=75948 RepID=A0AA35ZRH6_LACSI|nr:unnamed protein product [Lactuca saligna]
MDIVDLKRERWGKKFPLSIVKENGGVSPYASPSPSPSIDSTTSSERITPASPSATTGPLILQLMVVGSSEIDVSEKTSLAICFPLLRSSFSHASAIISLPNDAQIQSRPSPSATATTDRRLPPAILCRVYTYEVA